MEKELARKAIETLKSISGSRHWSISTCFDQFDEKSEIEQKFTAGLFIGNDCFVGTGKTLEEALGSVMLRTQERPVLKAVTA